MNFTAVGPKKSNSSDTFYFGEVMDTENYPIIGIYVLNHHVTLSVEGFASPQLRQWNFQLITHVQIVLQAEFSPFCCNEAISVIISVTSSLPDWSTTQDLQRLVFLELGNKTHIKVKVKCTLVQALRLSTGRTVHRGIRGVILLFPDHGTRRGWGVSVTHRPLFTPGKTRYPFYRSLGGPQGRSGHVRKISPHRDSIPGPSSP